MAIGSPIILRKCPDNLYGAVSPCSINSHWETAIDAGGMDDQDAAVITNPDTQIILSTRHPIHKGLVGTQLLFRLVYDDGLTAITDPIVKWFGRTGDSQVWQLLKNRSGGITTTITTQASDDGATDVTDGTFLYTTPDYETQAIDCLGCDTFFVGLETALAGTGDVTTAFLQVKSI